MQGLSVRNLVKRYGAVPAVSGVSFDVKPGEFVSLLGPSGCGKTTTLRCIAGFEDPDAGTITVDGEVVVDAATGRIVPPNRRRFGMVFQSYAVWPHMTVLENVSYPLTVSGGHAKAEIAARAADKLAAVGLTGFEGRYPSQLSGGQQQRVAVARALVMEPRLLLFDEPLSNLDAKLRERMRFELVEIQSRLSIPAVYVTHDQTEAMVMSTRVAVMNHGEIVQNGEPEEVYQRPTDRFVAEFIGACNAIPGKAVAAGPDGSWLVETAFGALTCGSGTGVAPGEPVLLVVRPEHIQLRPRSGTGTGLAGVVERRYFLGASTEYVVDLGSCGMRVLAMSSDFRPGDQVDIELPPRHCRVLPEAAAGRLAAAAA